MNTKQLEERVKSIGEERMRLSYESEVITTVEKIKNMTAQLIDICEDLKRFDIRLASAAQTDFEKASFLAVKAATTSIPIENIKQKGE